jgi:hypothetical protein
MVILPVSCSTHHSPIGEWSGGGARSWQLGGDPEGGAVVELRSPLTDRPQHRSSAGLGQSITMTIGIHDMRRSASAIDCQAGKKSAGTTRIWIEPVKTPNGRNWYTDRNGLLLRTRLGAPDGEVLCDRIHNPVGETCRVLISRGIAGAFETWKVGIPYPCMRGDISSTAELTVQEPDNGIVHFTSWRPFDQNAVSRSAVPAPTRENDGGGREIAAEAIEVSCEGGEQLADAAE